MHMQICLFASILFERRKIPSLAALMAFELHGDTASKPAELAVRLVMQVRTAPAACCCRLHCSCCRAAEAAGCGAWQHQVERALVRPSIPSWRPAWHGPCCAAERPAQPCATIALQHATLPANARSTRLRCRHCRTARASHTPPSRCPAPPRAMAPKRWRGRGPARSRLSGPWLRRWPSTPQKNGAHGGGAGGPGWRLSASVQCCSASRCMPDAAHTFAMHAPIVPMRFTPHTMHPAARRAGAPRAATPSCRPAGCSRRLSTSLSWRRGCRVAPAQRVTPAAAHPAVPAG